MVIAYMRKYDTPPVCWYMRIWYGYALKVLKSWIWYVYARYLRIFLGRSGLTPLSILCLIYVGSAFATEHQYLPIL